MSKRARCCISYSRTPPSHSAPLHHATTPHVPTCTRSHGPVQRGAEAMTALNLYEPWTYEELVDVDAYADPTELQAVLDQMAFMGQTPWQLLHAPHPKRFAPNDLRAPTTIVGAFCAAATATTKPGDHGGLILFSVTFCANPADDLTCPPHV